MRYEWPSTCSSVQRCSSRSRRATATTESFEDLAPSGPHGAVGGEDDGALEVALADDLNRAEAASLGRGRCWVEGGTPCDLSAAGLSTPARPTRPSPSPAP